uniref:ubiquitinyl hydrolase 1 n=1 Tax=Strigamia maritima TaxID=126957 RepID=T1J253_STRMM
MTSSNFSNRETDSQQRFFLVNTDCFGLVLRSKLKSGDVEKDKELEIGTILRELVTDRHDRTKCLQRPRQLVVSILDYDWDLRETYAVDIKNLMPVNEDDAFLLLSVPRPRDRMRYWQNNQFMNETKTIKEYTPVLVCSDSKSQTSLPGIVMKKGDVPGYRGTHFTIKLIESGNMAKDNSILICPFYKLRLNTGKSRSYGNDKSTINIGAKLQQQLSPNSSQVSCAKSQNENQKFNLNERVAWLNEKGALEYGTVRHLGVMPGETDVLVGVEFDNAVGTGDGRYQSKTLFKTKPKHAAFIPIEELKKKKDAHSSSLCINNYRIHSRLSSKILDEIFVHFIFIQKKKDSDSKKSSGTSTFYDEKPPISDSKISKQFREYHDRPPTSVIAVEIGKQVARNDDGVKVEVKSSPSSPKSRKQPSPLHSPSDLKDEMYNQPSQTSSPIFSSIQVNRFPTPTNESLSPALSQEKRFASEQAYSGRSTSISMDQQKRNTNPKALNKTIPSPTQHKRNSSALETRDSRARSTQSSDRSGKTESPIITKAYDEWDKEEFANEKAKDEKKPELFSDKVKNGKTKSKENINAKTENSTSTNLLIDSRGSQKRYSQPPESTNENEYRHVMKDDCLSSESKDVEIPFYDDLEKFLSLTDFFEMDKPVEQKTEFGVGSVVEVTINGHPWYGVIRWIGEIEGKPKIAGLEMDDTHAAFCEGELNGEHHFTCPLQKGFFVYLHLCRKDSRFLDSLQVNINDGKIPPAFGSKDCPIVSGEIPPLSYSEYVIQHLFGKNKGIQGHHNSCYLDATLFSMFTFTPVFDDLLNRPSTSADIDSYNTVQRVLKEEIVNPLRRNMYVRADRVMGLRTLLDKLSSVSGLTSEEKDPEEFLNSLLHQILKAEPYLKLSSGQEAFFYQLFIEKNEQLRVPTVQQLFDQSFLTSDIKLKQIPSCLIIQMPRHGKQYKMYNRIFPSPILDITDVLEDTPRECCICGKLAQHECRDCFYSCPPPFTLKSFCNECVRTTHQHEARNLHKIRKIKVIDYFRELATMSRVTMELFAVVCIETSHYVAFAKCGNEADVPWCFFDSMADRKGEQNGYNIPEIALCNNLSDWLSDEGLMELVKDPEKPLPDMPKRLFGDAYLCMYQNSSVMMYH